VNAHTSEIIMCRIWKQREQHAQKKSKNKTKT
jgi:hypothetical protein